MLKAVVRSFALQLLGPLFLAWHKSTSDSVKPSFVSQTGLDMMLKANQPLLNDGHARPNLAMSSKANYFTAGAIQVYDSDLTSLEADAFPLKVVTEKAPHKCTPTCREKSPTPRNW